MTLSERRGGSFFNMSANTPIAPNAPGHRRPKIARPRVRRSPSGWTEAMTRGVPASRAAATPTMFAENSQV